jgi:hypothetical protein
MQAFDLVLGLGISGGAMDLFHAPFLKPVGQIPRDIGFALSESRRSL